MSRSPPLLAVTMGDPCGIGPEIIAKALTQSLPAPCVVVGDVAVMRRALAACQLQWPVAELVEPEEALSLPPRCVGVWQPPGLPSAVATLPIGEVHADAGRAAIACIEAGAALTLAERSAALVTAPVHKQALAA